MNFEVTWVLVSLGTQVHLQIIHYLDYLPDYLSVSYDYVDIHLFRGSFKNISIAIAPMLLATKKSHLTGTFFWTGICSFFDNLNPIFIVN